MAEVATVTPVVETPTTKGIEEKVEEEANTNINNVDEDVKNIVAVPPQIEAKHPLQNKWKLWYYKNDRTKSWNDNLRPVTTFSTVEDFWSIYNHIQTSSKLHVGCDYNLFKDGIDPKWEDPQNKQGGKWQYQLQKTMRQTDLDRLWLETLMLMIGEGFGDDSEIVNGAVVQVRGKQDKSAIWLSESNDVDAVQRVGQTFKARLNLPKKISLQFFTHLDTMSKSGSVQRSRMTL